MMTAKGKIDNVLITLTFLGVQRNGASIGQRALREGKNRPSLPGTRVEYITDPSMNNMNAIAVTIPEKWHFQGVLFQAGSLRRAVFCVPGVESGWPELCGAAAAALLELGIGTANAGNAPACLHVQGPMSGRSF